MRKSILLFICSIFLYCLNINSQIVDSSKLKNSTKISVVKSSKDTLVNESGSVIKRDTVYLEKAKDSSKKLLKKPLDKLNIDASSPINNIGKLFSFWKIIWAIIILILTYYLIKFIIFILNRIKLKNESKYLILKNAAPFVRILGWVIAIFIVVEGVFNPPAETIFAVLASAGIAVGFAAQDILKNIFGGIMILFDRPFQIGDKIEVGDYYGAVVEIGLRSTRIVTADDSLVSIPNSEVVNTAVANSNAGENNCQVVAEIYLPIDIDTDLVRKIATETAQISRYIYLNKPVTVIFVNEVKERRSYLKMRLKAYVSDLKYEFSFKSDMTEIFLKELLGRKIITKEELI